MKDSETKINHVKKQNKKNNQQIETVEFTNKEKHFFHCSALFQNAKVIH